jgi:hypothetical protein
LSLVFTLSRFGRDDIHLHFVVNHSDGKQERPVFEQGLVSLFSLVDIFHGKTVEYPLRINKMETAQHYLMRAASRVGKF